MEITDFTAKDLFVDTANIEPSANRQYKARMFAEIFGNKKDALDLYNAVNNTDYNSTEELEITTLSDVIYMTMKNDLSFIIGFTMNLYEHQSSFNPNMPLRGLSYFARLYENYVRKNKLDIYSTTLLKLPKPQYIVFYNGEKDQPERRELYLSDAFENDGRENHLEVKAVMLNINIGYNHQLMEKCQALHDYAIFVDTVRRNLSSGMDSKLAIEQAINECISNNVLKSFLEKNKAGVVNMMLTEYDQELHERTLIEQGKKEGRLQGAQEGERMRRLMKLLLQEKLYDEMERALNDQEYREMLIKQYNL